MGLKCQIRSTSGSPRIFRPIVLKAEAPRTLVWRGSLPIPGLVTGEHSFLLTPEGEGIRFRNSETFSGLLIPFLGQVLRQSERGFHQMNAALKERAEHDSA